MKIFQYLQATGTTSVFALTTDLNDKLKINKRVMAPKTLAGLTVHEDLIVNEWQTGVTLCDNGCPVTVNEKVSVMFTGLLNSKAEKIQRLKDLVAIMESDDGNAILDGFPAGPNSSFTVLEASE